MNTEVQARVSFHEIEGCHPYERHDRLQRLVDKTVEATLMKMAAEQEAVVEEFLVSGAFLRDLSFVEERPLLSRWEPWSLFDCFVIGVSKNWRMA